MILFVKDKLKSVSYSEGIKQRLRRRIATPKEAFSYKTLSYSGIYEIDSEYGSGVHEYLSSPRNQTIFKQIRKAVIEALRKEGDFITILSVEVKPSKYELQVIEIEIQYELKETKEVDIVSLNL